MYTLCTIGNCANLNLSVVSCVLLKTPMLKSKANRAFDSIQWYQKGEKHCQSNWDQGQCNCFDCGVTSCAWQDAIEGNYWKT